MVPLLPTQPLFARGPAPARQASWTDSSDNNSSPTVSSARLNLYDSGACALQNSESTGWSATPFLLANPASLSILGVSSRHWGSHCLASKSRESLCPTLPGTPFQSSKSLGWEDQILHITRPKGSSLSFLFFFFFGGGGCGGTLCGLQDLSSPTRDRTHAPCSGSTESYPLDHQGSPVREVPHAHPLLRELPLQDHQGSPVREVL